MALTAIKPQPRHHNSDIPLHYIVYIHHFPRGFHPMLKTSSHTRHVRNSPSCVATICKLFWTIRFLPLFSASTKYMFAPDITPQSESNSAHTRINKYNLSQIHPTAKPCSHILHLSRLNEQHPREMGPFILYQGRYVTELWQRTGTGSKCFVGTGS